MAKNNVNLDTKSNQDSAKAFAKNTNYKQGDKIVLGGVELYAREDFTSGDIFDPSNWSNQDTTPRPKAILRFTSDKEGNTDGSIDITELLIDKFGSLETAMSKFKGIDFSCDGVSYRSYYGITERSLEPLRKDMDKIINTFVINPKQLRAVDSLFDDTFQRWNKGWYNPYEITI